ncbi:dol-P-Glc:Glc(2)Man(9)GlcNAc(2)-PP-Dol alpha-1,2-glucosyltransferase [Megalops cyprinoides]|uniref:dol-P-Glc:Glc(2)Man(9)GlcNAc(2)-PP-Dol alpha-1,2-glucosyltransferase n=1 Tax=Megalops cyprinoides TaxID=118141 RepID=UPI0018645001|nr:dol-P-Glc:Glc(2)Man(9)GlcNAc(2)-PP-Dol alpha-1,2-glucosyltransferase [Megalops cyprinoides]
MMERYEGYIFTALCSANFFISCLLFSKITREQRDPYMDEIFHVPQAQKYCQGKFSEWDPMITTLPGLYLVSVGVIKPLVWLAGWTGEVVCSTAMLRFINLLFNCGNLYLLYLITHKLHFKDKTRAAWRRALVALSLSTFPVLYFFTFLYYTDAGSTFFTLFAYLMTLYGSHKASALLGCGAILFRQTNIIWVAFCAGTVVAGRLEEAWETEQAKRREERPAGRSALSAGDTGRVLRFLLEYVTSPSRLRALLLAAWPYAAVATAFLLFVILNGGIVVGDRSSHEACLHFPQLFYFLSFSLLFSAPAALSLRRAGGFLHSLRKQPWLYLCAAALSLLLVWKFTFVHKYLLADNRHFPFYVWRRVFQRHPLVPFALVPGYVFAAWSFAESLKCRSVFWNLAFLVCVAAATVPQKLLEFRYFILPYLLYRLHMPLPSVGRLLLELALHAALNAATLHLFLHRPFQWPHSPALQRFMW